MHAFNVAASFSFSQTVCGGTASSYSPFMVIAIAGDSFARGLLGLVELSAYRLARRLKRVVGTSLLRPGWGRRAMPDIKTDDGCFIHVEVEGPQNAPVLMLSNSLGTNLQRGQRVYPPAHPRRANRGPRCRAHRQCRATADLRRHGAEVSVGQITVTLPAVRETRAVSC